MGDVVFFNRSGETKMTSISEVARFFLTKGTMTHLKLQKMCYYAQAWYLAIFGKRLFNETFQAWMHGPVAPSLYQQYKHWGWYEISEYAGGIRLCDEVIAFLEMIYTLYGSYTGEELERLTHMEEPWIKARNGATGYCTNAIPDDSMKKYYRNILDQVLKSREADGDN